MSQPVLWFTQSLDKIDLHVKHAALCKSTPSSKGKKKKTNSFVFLTSRKLDRLYHWFKILRQLYAEEVTLSSENKPAGFMLSGWLWLTVEAGWLMWAYISRLLPNYANGKQLKRALCFVARVRGGGIFHNHMRKRGSPVQRWEGYTGRVSLYTPRGNTDVHASHLCAHAHTQMKFGVGEGRQEVVQEVIMVLKNTALVSTALTNLCWDIPNFLPEQKSTHKHTTVCIYADEHT